MVKLSVVVAGRDDGYGDDSSIGIYDLSFRPIKNIERVLYCLEVNLKLLELRFGNQFEYLYVDWAPPKNRILGLNSSVKKIDKNNRIRHLVVRESAIKSRHLNTKSFYEYHAKNVGLRNSIGQYCLIMNSDDFLSHELVEEIGNVIESGKTEYFYRPKSRVDVFSIDPLKISGEGASYSDEDFFGTLGTSAAGDFILSHKSNWWRIQGFDEKSNRPFRRKLRQSGLDGQCLIQFYLYGIKPFFLNSSIFSIDHNKIKRNYSGMKLESYRNDSNWGLGDRQIRVINPGIFEIV